MSKQNEKAHHRALLLLNQSMRDCSPEEIGDALFELVELEAVFGILDRVLTKHQARLEQIIADQKDGKGDDA